MKTDKFNRIYSGFMLLFFIFVTIQLLFLRGRDGFNPGYISTYLYLGFFAIIIAAITFAFDFVKKNETGGFSFIADTSKLVPFSKYTWQRFIPGIIFTALTLTGMVVAKTNILPIPAPLAQDALGISQATQAWYMSIPPGLFEDFMILTLANLLMFGIMAGLKKITKVTPVTYFIVTIPVAVIVSWGWDGLFPGFAAWHNLAYGANQALYFSAFFFQVINMIIMLNLGLFFPIAHVMHNATFAFGLTTALSITLFGIIMLRNKKHTEVIQNGKSEGT